MNDKLFLDTNVLVYLVNIDSEYHSRAIELYTQSRETHELWISRQVLREYAVIVSRLRDVSNPADSIEVSEDLEKWETVFHVADETSNVTKNLRNLIKKYSLKGKRIHDANITATMMEYGIKTLLTWNSGDFEKFKEIELTGI